MDQGNEYLDDAIGPGKGPDALGSESIYRQPSQQKFVFSLQCLFQIVTGCGLFFGLVRFSPLLAMLLTLLITPAIIRTGQAAEFHYRNGVRFDLKKRVSFFAESIGIVLLIIAVAVSAFVLVIGVFGFLGWMSSFMLSDSEASINSMMIGFIAGIVWGMAGAVFAVGCVLHKTWPHGLRFTPSTLTN